MKINAPSHLQSLPGIKFIIKLHVQSFHFPVIIQYFFNVVNISSTDLLLLNL